MTALRAEILNLVEEIPEEKLENFLNVIKKFIKDEDPFWSKENQEYLQKSIREMEEGKVVVFTDEEWEKFLNEQKI